jgi:hypothetical protein
VLFLNLAAYLNLDEDELPETFDEDLVDSARELDEIFESVGDYAMALFASNLHKAALRLVESPSPQTMAKVLDWFLALLNSYRELVRHESACKFWRLAAQYSDVAANMAHPAPAENQSFEHLPEMLASLPWVTDFLLDLARSGGLTPGERDHLASFSPMIGRRLLDRAEQSMEGMFMSGALRVQRGLENRLRQVWLIRQMENADPTAVDLYAAAFSSLFPYYQLSLTGARVTQEMGRLRRSANALSMPEVAECLENPEWMAQYALMHFMPPDPARWAPAGIEHFNRLLFGRVARWHSYPFLYVLSPIELVAGVLRLGRPHFYERAVAHALIEYVLFQPESFESHYLGHYLDAKRAMGVFFQLFLEGLLLRLAYYPRLKEPRGWCEYLDALQRLHEGEAALPELHPFRRNYLRDRGVSSVDELLCRLAAAPGAVQ